MRVCDSCLDRIHSRCKGDRNDDCGCHACYGDPNRSPFHVPPDGTPHDAEAAVVEGERNG